MKKTSLLINITVCCLLFSSCSSLTQEDKAYNFKNSQNPEMYEETDVHKNYKSEKSTLLKKQNSQPLKIIKNAECRFLVKNVDSITKLIIKHANNEGGYVADMRFNQNKYEIENKLSLSIPSEVFESFVTTSTKLAEFVDYSNITSKNVTEEYIDLTNRLKVKEEVKLRYEAILRSKTKTLKDVLETEKQIQQIQEEIEAAKGRINYINKKSNMSTIDLSLYEKVTHSEHPETYTHSFSNKSKSAFKTGWEFIKNLLLGLIYIWPILLIGLVVFGLIRRRTRKVKKNSLK